MKKVIFSMIALFMFTSCSWVKVRYNSGTSKAVAKEHRSLNGFKRIELLGSLDVKYAQADTFSVLVQGPVERVKDVKTRVEGSVLRIQLKDDTDLMRFVSSNDDDITVYVTSPDFLGIELKGSGDFECHGLLDTDTLDMLLLGSGDIDFRDIICDQVSAKLIGSGDIDVKNVNTQKTSIELIGSGDVKMHFSESGAVTSSLRGSGDIQLSGTVEDLKSRVRGSGDMNTRRLNIRTR